MGIKLHERSPILDRVVDLDTGRKQVAETKLDQNVLFTEDTVRLRLQYRNGFGPDMTTTETCPLPGVDPLQQRLNSLK